MWPHFLVATGGWIDPPALNYDGDRDWALVGIPPHASRESIAVALAELAGVAWQPFVIDLLLMAGRARSV